MNKCPDCGKPLYEDAIHTCSPQYDSEDTTNELIANSKLPPALALANHLERTNIYNVHTTDARQALRTAIEQAIKDEREACAKVCDKIKAVQNDGCDDGWEFGIEAGAKRCADAIRALTIEGEKT